MKVLEQRILADAKVVGNNRLKVDMFLNHQIDVDLLKKIGKEFYKRFQDDNITKILTVEASGIAIACAAAEYFHVPVVFAKKGSPKHIESEVYTTKVYSFTKSKSFQISISKDYLKKDDRILIIDDLLGNGESVLGLYNMIISARADLIGVGMVIERGYMPGGEILRNRGIRLESLAVIQSMENGKIILK